MSKEMGEHIDTFKQRLLKENEEFNENDTTEYLDCLSCLKKVNNGIHRQEVMLWFKENDIDYFNMSELDMYIYYIEKNSVSEIIKFNKLSHKDKIKYLVDNFSMEKVEALEICPDNKTKVSDLPKEIREYFK